MCWARCCFLIFINDLDLDASSAAIVVKFADDTKVAQPIASGGPGWAGALGRRVGNGLQCGQVQGHAHRPQESPVQLHHAKHALDSHRGGETWASSRASGLIKHGAQCTKAAKTAQAVLGQIARAFHFRDRHVFVQLYTTYVMPHLCGPSLVTLDRGGQGCVRTSAEASHQNGVGPEKSRIRSVAEPVGAGTFWLEPEPVKRCEGKNMFFTTF